MQLYGVGGEKFCEVGLGVILLQEMEAVQLFDKGAVQL